MGDQRGEEVNRGSAEGEIDAEVIGRPDSSPFSIDDETSDQSASGESLPDLPDAEVSPANSTTKISDHLVSTGNRSLDRVFGGGLRPGNLIAVEGAPQTQSSDLVRAFICDDRPVYFLSQLLSEQEIDDKINEEKLLTEQERNIFEIASLSVSEVLQRISNIADVRGPKTIVVDCVRRFESGDTQDYIEFLQQFREALDKSTIGVLHCTNQLREEQVPELRHLSHKAADLSIRVNRPTANSTDESMFVDQIPSNQPYIPDERELLLRESTRGGLRVESDESINT